MGFFTIYTFLCIFCLMGGLAVRYFRAEGRLRDRREFLHLMLFPFTGYGDWRYRFEGRRSEPVYPRRWFILKNLVVINTVVLAMSVFGLLLFFFRNAGLTGTVSSENDHQAHGFAIFADVLVGVMYLVVFLVVLGFFAGLAFIGIVIPGRAVRAIEKSHLKNPEGQAEAIDRITP